MAHSRQQRRVQARAAVKAARASVKLRDWDKLSANQQRRYTRYGITPSYYESGGSLVRARGHLPREHITRRERNPLGLTSGDYRFLKNQQRRAKRTEFAGPTAAFKRMTRAQRDRLRARVAADHREYKRQKSRSGVVRGEAGAGEAANREVFREVFRESSSVSESDYGEEPEEQENYEEIDFEDYDDIYPDFDDDDIMALSFYH